MLSDTVQPEFISKCMEQSIKSLERLTERSPYQYGHPFKKSGAPTTIKFRRYNTFNKKEE